MRFFFELDLSDSQMSSLFKSWCWNQEKKEISISESWYRLVSSPVGRSNNKGTVVIVDHYAKSYMFVQVQTKFIQLHTLCEFWTVLERTLVEPNKLTVCKANKRSIITPINRNNNYAEAWKDLEMHLSKNLLMSRKTKKCRKTCLKLAFCWLFKNFKQLCINAYLVYPNERVQKVGSIWVNL